jgi:hypothetical protein
MMVMRLPTDVLIEKIHMAIQVTTNRAGATLVRRGMVVEVVAVLGKRMDRGTSALPKAKSLLQIRIAVWDLRRVMRSVLRR